MNNYGKFLQTAATAFALCFVGCGGSGGGDGNVGNTRTIHGIECVLVKAGEFTMGSPAAEVGRGSDETQYRVTLTKDFWISKYEVAQARYREVTGVNPSDAYGVGDRYPVYNVSWEDAAAFCAAVDGRLPTEAEWEFAARGGNWSEGYIYGGSDDIDDVAWYWDDIPSQEEGAPGFGPQPVGTKTPNELDIYDMSGNVWEWCGDWYGKYPSGSATDPTGPGSGEYRVIRGGAWHAYSRYCRVAARFRFLPSNSNPDLGFRVVFDAD